MSTYRASARVEDGILHTARPLTAPPPVMRAMDGAVLALISSGGTLVAVDLTFTTSEDSDTPIADEIVGTSSTPLPSGGHAADDDEDVADVPQPVLATTVGSQA